MLLDTGILGIVGDDESDPDEVTQLVAEVLRDSLWERQLRRFEQQGAAAALRELVNSRAPYVWSISTAAQRRGWYLAGLGANAGSELGVVAADVVGLIAQAEVAIEDGDTDVAADRLGEIATTLFGMSQFNPDTSLDDWRSILAHWLNGQPLDSCPNSARCVSTCRREAVETCRKVEPR